jgi:hypothetical protein
MKDSKVETRCEMNKKNIKMLLILPRICLKKHSSHVVGCCNGEVSFTVRQDAPTCKASRLIFSIAKK